MKKKLTILEDTAEVTEGEEKLQDLLPGKQVLQ